MQRNTLAITTLICGLLLLSGLAVRGAASLSLLMLIPFSIVVLLRALRLHDANGLPFCAIRFDCGCGGGEVVICHKLAENTLLILTAALLLIVPARRWCLRRDLLRSRG